ncbi:MAG: divalent cation tolerance protein CutA, partial [Rhodospirillaceae bacterium]|nr:divalent cation tolerance protein CutA [Rhodospirillaceae bacterium]
NIAALTEAIKQRHTYDCPCIVALPIEGGNADFLDWINQETL